MKKGIIIIIMILIIVNNIIWYLFTVSTDEIKVEHISKYMNYPTIPTRELKERILNDGDEKAYNELFTFLVDEKKEPESFLFWAMIKANKFNDPLGYYSVFYCIAETDYSNSDSLDKYPRHIKYIDTLSYLSLDHLDSSSRNLALKYLQIAADKGILEAKEQLNVYSRLGIYQIPPDKRRR